MKDQVSWYEVRRNELLELLKKTSGLNIPKEHDEKLRAIRRKCLENQFEIVLVGEFQGGKSTTFDTLCGGRDLSPRGLGGGGIKTSAAVISAQNISDGEEKDGMEEWAELTFKSKSELLQSMFEVIRKAEVKKQFSDFDLDNESDRKILLRAVEQLWNQEENKDPDTADNLRIATLILKFYGTPEYRELCEKKITEIYEFQKLIAFPTDWETRWLDKSSFSFDEIAFVFISRVLLRIKSPDLERLGCRITDCPGLFANAYDTRVAMTTINSSDAVWYLLNGDKQLGQSDLKILKMIRDLGVNDREIVSANMKENHEQKIKMVLPVTESILKKNDLPRKAYPYNARLAFLSEQGKRILSKTLSEQDIGNMKIDSDEEDGTPEKMWLNMVTDRGSAIKKDEIKKLDKLNEDAVRAVRAESRVDGILTPIGEQIISGKARSILLDNGSAKAAEALEKYEGKLRTEEIAAETDVQTWKQTLEESRKKLDNFIRFAKDLIDESELNKNQNELAEDLAEKLLTDSLKKGFFIQSCGDKLEKTVKELGKNWYWFIRHFRQAVMEKVSPEIQSIIALNLAGTLNEWQEYKKNTLWRSYLRLLEDICSGIRKRWETEISVVDLLKGITFKPEDIDLVMIVNLFFDDAALFGLLTSWQALFPTLGAIWNKIVGNQPNYHVVVDKIFSRDEFRKPLQQQLKVYFLNNVIGKTLENLRSALDKMKNDFESRCSKAEAERDRSAEERRHIADENRRIRTTEIQPVRKEIQEFQKQVEKELAQFERKK